MSKNINVIGNVNLLSFGYWTLNTIKALDRAGYNVSWFQIAGQIEADPKYHDLLRKCGESAAFFDDTAPNIRIYHPFSMDMFTTRGKRIGWTLFELDKLRPVEKHHLNTLDKILVPSKWHVEILEQELPGFEHKRTFVVPLGVDREIFKPYFVAPSETTHFIHIGKAEIRKGLDIILECFNKAFEITDDVKLTILSFNPFIENNPSKPRQSGNLEWANMFRKQKLASKVDYIIERPHSQHDIVKLINSADCGLFPARAEGFLLPALEMLSCGKHIITTNYSGHTEFCNKENSYLMDLPTKEIAYDGEFFFGDGQWGSFRQQEKDQFIDYMKHFHKDKQSKGNLRNEAGIKTAEKFTWDNAIKTLLETLEV